MKEKIIIESVPCFLDDREDVPTDRRLTKAQKSQRLELMLGQIANWCSTIARNTFVKESTSLEDVWQKIRLHLGFQRTGAHFLDLAAIQMEHGEKPETLFQRLNAFFQDNLLQPHFKMTHHGDKVYSEEDMSPSLENTVIVLWLKLIHPALPA